MDYTHFIEVWGASNSRPYNSSCKLIKYLKYTLANTYELECVHTIAVFKIKLKP